MANDAYLTAAEVADIATEAGKGYMLSPTLTLRLIADLKRYRLEAMVRPREDDAKKAKKGSWETLDRARKRS